MNLDTFKAECEYHTEKILELVNKHMKNDGDKCSESQRICMIIAIDDLESTINGITKRNMK